MKRKLRFLFFIALLFTAVILPRVQAEGDDDIARCATNRTSCQQGADNNYTDCMNTPTGNYIVCSAWWYYDMRNCLDANGCSGTPVYI